MKITIIKEDVVLELVSTPKEDLKQDILDYLNKKNKPIPIEELARNIDGFAGDYLLKLPNNAVLHCGISVDGMLAFFELANSKKIKLKLDGTQYKGPNAYSLGITKDITFFHEEYVWFPTLISIY